MASDNGSSREHFVFPKWANLLLPLIIIGAVGTMPYMHALVPLVASPTTLNVGYQPVQPVPYSHELHVDELGIDCRYCHTSVESAAFAAIPPTATCMNCHHAIQNDSEKIAPIIESYETGKPIEWVKVHDLPDYVYFNHAVHVSGAGVSCVECHGRVDKMGEAGVHTVENLSMSWCIECHRNAAPNLRPRDLVYDLAWQRPADADSDYGKKLAELHNVPSSRNLTDCSTCHR